MASRIKIFKSKGKSKDKTKNRAADPNQTEGTSHCSKEGKTSVKEKVLPKKAQGSKSGDEPSHLNKVSSSQSASHQNIQTHSSTKTNVQQVQDLTWKIKQIRPGNEDHPGSPTAVPAAPYGQQQLEEVHGASLMSMRHPGAPDEKETRSNEGELQNEDNQCDVPGGLATNPGMEASGGVASNVPPETEEDISAPGTNGGLSIHEGEMPHSNQEQHFASAAANKGLSVDAGYESQTSSRREILADETREQRVEPVDPPSLTHPPTQESEEVTATRNVQVGAAAHEERPLQAIFCDQRLAVETVMGNKELQDRLTRPLDRAHRVISCWEHLACTENIKAPLETRLRCKLNAEHSPTEILMDILSVEKGDTKLKKFVKVLGEDMRRNDVVEIVKKYYPDAENSTELISDTVASNSDLIEKMATKLDQVSRINKYWIHLGREFKISGDRLKEIEYRNNPTLAVMEYSYSSQKPMTVVSFSRLMEGLNRFDVVEKVKHCMEESAKKEMRDVVPLESDTMRKICICLNNPNNALKNWRHLANFLGINKEIYDDFNPKDLKSPTVVLFDWIFAKKPRLTVGELCLALKDIGRNDLVDVVRKHLQ